MNVINRISLLASIVLLLSACSGGSGSGTVVNADTRVDTDTGIVYTGPAPQTENVQGFKVSVWDNLVPENRCGSCHSVAGGQSPMFVRSDDINEAYQAANTIVDLGDPAQSRMVTKVAGGHNCWLDSNSACGDIITNYIAAWANTAGATANVIVLQAPQLKDVGNSKTFPADSLEFANTIYPVLRTYCVACHIEDSLTAQQPYIASADVDAAYEAAKSRITIDNPDSSRLVSRLRNEFHNCWTNCSANADTMSNAISAFTGTIVANVVDPDLVLSKALRLPDGIIASSGGRVENNIIARYEFKTGEGNTAFDTSGVDPAINLNLIGDVDWLGSWGIRLNGGKAQGSTGSSKKLHDLITLTGEYSLEAWVVPDNVTQDGPARIVSYSGGADIRNFTLGQTLYNYNFLNRSDQTDSNGMPALSSPDADEVLQATLQHVVLTYDPFDGRRVFVNGEDVAGADDTPAGILAGEWDDGFALVLGQETSGEDQWLGTVRLLAIHNRALSGDEVLQNFDAGVGEKFFLLFSVSHLIEMPEAYVVFEVQQFDDYGYLFNSPFFISLDGDATPGSVVMKGLRIGINGREAEVGQSFASLDFTVSDANYSSEGVELSELGTVIALENGADADEFFITFDQLGDNEYVRVEALPPTAQAPADLEEQSDIGLRKFEEINAALSAITGVSSVNPNVAATYEKVRQQLPTVENLGGFLAAHQMAVTQLAVKYCSELVGELSGSDTSARSAFFPNFNFSANVSNAFDTSGRANLIGPLQEKLLLNSGLASQPDANDLALELNNLIDIMQSSCAGSCSAEPDRTLKIAKAICAAATGSAAMLLQ